MPYCVGLPFEKPRGLGRPKAGKSPGCGTEPLSASARSSERDSRQDFDFSEGGCPVALKVDSTQAERLRRLTVGGTIVHEDAGAQRNA